MNELVDLVKEILGQDELSEIGGRIDADEDTTKKAIGAALPVLISALGRQADSPSGATKLSEAVEHAGGGILESIIAFLRGSHLPPESHGEVLKDVFGQRSEQVERSVSNASGLDLASVKKLLTVLAPIVLGAIAKLKASANLDADGVAGYLRREGAALEGKFGGVLGNLLDQDGDNDVDLADVVKVAKDHLFA